LVTSVPHHATPEITTLSLHDALPIFVIAKLPLIGFDYSTDQLFWLAALPGLSGATLRIFYSFMVPIFGGRLWTTLTTLSLLIPAFGIGYAVQNPDTPYFIFLVLSLLCGLGGGNFASS